MKSPVDTLTRTGSVIAALLVTVTICCVVLPRAVVGNDTAVLERLGGVGTGALPVPVRVEV